MILYCIRLHNISVLTTQYNIILTYCIIYLGTILTWLGVPSFSQGMGQSIRCH